MVVGTTFDLEMINGISWMVDEGMLAKGDTIGHVHLQGEFGENALAGSEFAAKELGLTLVSQAVTPTAPDVTSQVAALKNQGVKAILLSTTPGQTASAAAADAATGLNVPLLGSTPSFAPQLMNTAAGPALAKLYYLVQVFQVFGSEEVGPTKVREAFAKKYPKEVPSAVVTGAYAMASAFGSVLERACENGDLTRAGVLEALPQITEADTEGIMAPLDFSDHALPPSRSSIMARPDAAAPGGLALVTEFAASDLATSYGFPAAK